MSLNWMGSALAELVSCESPSTESDATRTCGQLLAELASTRLDARPELIELAGRTHLRYTWGEPRVLVLGHLDTVWPLGTLARWPYSTSGDIATGPGVFDMKAGVIQALAALSMLDSLDGVRLLLTVDEELGSPTSADLVIDSSKGCAATFVCEPSAAGALKIARKGVAIYQIAVIGRAAHAGLEPEKGANAGIALAHAIVGAAALGAPDLGTTVTPTQLSGGTTTNTVPAAATVALDVRVSKASEFARLETGLRSVAEAAALAVPGTTVELHGGINRPPLETSSSDGLFATAQKLAALLGIEPPRGVAVGGGSDGNLTAGAGIPTLDGLGAVGDGAHAEGEYIQLSAMEPRARLLAALIGATR